MGRRHDLPTDVARALSHRLRQRLVLIYGERPTSPSAVAERLGEPLGNVAYHTKKLVEQGCLELVGTAAGRGGVSHTYRATLLHEVEDDTWSELPPALRRSLGGGVVSELGSDVKYAAAAGGLEAEDVHLSRLILELDERGRNELSVMLREAVARVDAISAASARRTSDTHRSVLAILHFRIDEAIEGRKQSLAL